jgi:hypothetical protein
MSITFSELLTRYGPDQTPPATFDDLVVQARKLGWGMIGTGDCVLAVMLPVPYELAAQSRMADFLSEATPADAKVKMCVTVHRDDDDPLVEKLMQTGFSD